eukprot:422304_1
MITSNPTTSQPTTNDPTEEISPTYSNSTSQYFETSVYDDNITYFRNNIISCTKPICHIICDEPFACSNLTINASLSQMLTIKCIKHKTCFNMVIHAEQTDNIYVECSYSPSSNIENAHACYELDLYATQSLNTTVYCTDYNCQYTHFHLNNTGHVSLSFNGLYAGFFANIYAMNVSNGLTITCNGDRSCELTVTASANHVSISCVGQNACTSTSSNIIDVALSDSIDLTCNDRFSCASMDLFCPYLYQHACNIICGNVTDSCSGINIFVPNSYVYGYLDITCSFGLICQNIQIKCENDLYRWGLTLLKYENQKYTCSTQYGALSGILNWCPYDLYLDKIVCVSGLDCDIVCANDDCSKAVIDGTDSNYLTVTCNKGIYSDSMNTSSCYGTSIICPVSGCTINCNDFGCSDTQLLYDGQLTDNGIVSLICNGVFSCVRTTIDAQYANQIDISCLSNNNWTCYDIKLDGSYSNKINIFANNSGAIFASDMYMENATNIAINAHGWAALYYSNWHAENADLLTISCRSETISNINTTDSGACVRNEWYIPHNMHNTIIYCYGDGCRNLGKLYVANNVSGVQINIDLCDECSNIERCISSFQIACDDQVHEYHTSSSSCVNIPSRRMLMPMPNFCGCSDLMDRMNYFNQSNPNFKKCFPTETPTHFPTKTPTHFPTETPTIETTIEA